MKRTINRSGDRIQLTRRHLHLVSGAFNRRFEMRDKLGIEPQPLCQPIEITALHWIIDVDGEQRGDVDLGRLLRRTRGLAHVDMDVRKVAPYPPDIAARIQAVTKAHAAVPRPDGIGRRIAMQVK